MSEASVDEQTELHFSLHATQVVLNQNHPCPVATARGNMYSTIMCEPHTVSILVDVINPLKYSVYHPAVVGVRWDAEAMKCYCLPLSPFLLALFPLFCS